MSRVLIVCFTLGLLSGASCRRSAIAVAAHPQCGAGALASWSADSSIAICLPPEFRLASAPTGDHARWERGDLQSPKRAWISISIDTGRTPGELRPPHLESSPTCRADCASADSVSRYQVAMADGIASVETGLVTGGLPGFRRQPLLVASWELSSGGHVWSSGLAANLPALDTLRRALGSVRIRRF